MLAVTYQPIKAHPQHRFKFDSKISQLYCSARVDPAVPAVLSCTPSIVLELAMPPAVVGSIDWHEQRAAVLNAENTALRNALGEASEMFPLARGNAPVIADLMRFGMPRHIAAAAAYDCTSNCLPRSHRLSVGWRSRFLAFINMFGKGGGDHEKTPAMRP